MQVLIADDEALARKRLRSFLEDRPEAPEITEAKSGVEALELLRGKRFDLVFLDIQMPGFTGFELLAQIEQRDFALVFQTAYDEFAVKAFEENACDYLLKPFDEARFAKAFEKALAQAGKTAPFSALEKTLRESGTLSRLLVKQGAKSLLVPVDEALAFVSRDHYSFLVAQEKEYILDLSLTHLEARLDAREFQRLHRNSLVRLASIRAVTGGDNMEVELENGLRLPVARGSRAKLKQFLGK